MLCLFAFQETPCNLSEIQEFFKAKSSKDNKMIVYSMGQDYCNTQKAWVASLNVLPEDWSLDLRTVWSLERMSCCRAESQALCACSRQVHTLLTEDTGVNLQSCRSRGGCQDMWWLCRSVSCLKLNWLDLSQMWLWNGSVMTDKNNPLIIRSPITNYRFWFSPGCTGHKFSQAHFFSSLIPLSFLPVYKAPLTCQKNPTLNDHDQTQTYISKSSQLFTSFLLSLQSV